MRAKPSLQLLWAVLLRILVAVAAAFLVVVLLSWAVSVPPQKALEALRNGALGEPGNPRDIRFARDGTLRHAIPILLTGLAVAWAFRAGLFNIGAEGQLLWGAIAAAWVGAAWKLPAPLHVTAALAAGAAAGALWAWPAAYLKARRGAPEVLTTLLLSFVAENLTTFSAIHLIHDPTQQGPRTANVLATAVLPRLPDSRLHVGLYLALGMALLLGLVLRRARLGFQVQVVGRSPEAARSSGIDVPRVWSRVLLQSGALAGLAGAVEVLGVHHYFQAGFSPGYGYEGIAVAILGGAAPAGVVLAALFWGGLANGAVEMEMSTGISRHLVTVIQALVVVAVAVRKWPTIPLPRRPSPPGGGAAVTRAAP